MTRVVHCKREAYDVYIGRPGPWGNPFRIGVDGSRERIIELFEQWVTTSNDPNAVWIREHVAYLGGKVLGCWCSPQPCHGDVLARMAWRLDTGKLARPIKRRKDEQSIG
jgi:hypothetical protein